MCSGRSGAKSNEAPMVVCGVQRCQRLREIPLCVDESGKRGRPLVQQPREHGRAFTLCNKYHAANQVLLIPWDFKKELGEQSDCCL